MRNDVFFNKFLHCSSGQESSCKSAPTWVYREKEGVDEEFPRSYRTAFY